MICDSWMPIINVTRKIAKPLDSETAKSIVADLGQWTTHAPDVDDVLEAYRLCYTAQSLAIISACSSTVWVAFSCMSGG